MVDRQFPTLADTGGSGWQPDGPIAATTRSQLNYTGTTNVFGKYIFDTEFFSDKEKLVIYIISLTKPI